MIDLTIHLFHKTEYGWVANLQTFRQSDFCGRIPSAGDFIIDANQRRSPRQNAEDQTMLEVVRSVYHPHKSNALVLLVTERVPYADEHVFIERLI